MAPDDHLLDLLASWEERYHQGRDTPAEELAPNDPPLQEELRQRIGRRKRVLQVLRGGPVNPTHAPALAAQPPGIPGYEVLEEVGRGGMGVVYRAWHIPLGRVVALKLIRAGAHADAQDLARFRAEAEAVARLVHPNIVQVYDVGEHGGLPFFSLEYCEGGSLEKKLQGRPLPPAEAARLLEVVARAAHAAHLRQLIHRDLKPANLLLQPRKRGPGEPGEPATPPPALASHYDVKITDFGLAKRLDATQLTASGAIMGTPSYMAPEQVRGSSRHIGPATDVHALGAVLYELLTGRPPFQAVDPVDVLLQVAGDEPVAPTRLQPKCPRDLETICLKCLHKDPTKRYASAEALAEDLGRFLQGRPIVARPVGAVGRGWRWCRRNPAVAALLAAVVVVLVAGSVVSTYLGLEAQAQARSARAAAEDARAWAESEQRQRRRADESLYVSNISRAWRAGREGSWGEAGLLLAPFADRDDLRGWEWHALHRESHGELARLEGHTGPVWSLAFSPDGARLASAGPEGPVRIWETATRKLLHTLPGNDCAAFSPDGRWLATPSANEVLIWDLARGKKQRALGVARARPRCVAFSPDGSRLAAGHGDGSVTTWDTASWEEHRSFKWHSDEALCIAYGPDGSVLATGGMDRAVFLVNPATGALVRRLGMPMGVRCLSFSQDGAWLLATSFDGANGIVGLTGGPQGSGTSRWQIPRRFIIHRHHPAGLSPDGGRIALASTDNNVRVWEVGSVREPLVLGSHQAQVQAVAFSPDGSLLASADADGVVKLWSVSSGPLLRIPRATPVYVSFSGDGRLLAAEADGGAKVWDVRTGQELFSATDRGLETSAASLSRDGRLLAIAAVRPGLLRRLGEVTVCDLTKPQKQWPIGRFESPIFDMDLSPDGKWLLSVTREGACQLWDAAAGRERATPARDRKALRARFSPDGRLFALADSSGQVQVCQMPDGGVRTLLGEEMSPDQTAASLAFSPDGAKLATGLVDGTVTIWDVTRGDKVQTLARHGDVVTSVSFHPDGTRLASTARGAETKVWDLETGKSLCTIPSRGMAGVFSPDGTLLVTGDFDGPDALILWDARPPGTGKVEQEARGLVDFLWARHLRRERVLPDIHASKAIGEEVRSLALEIAEDASPDFWNGHRAKDLEALLSEGGRTTFEYTCAWRRAEGLLPDPEGQRAGLLGAACYRLDRYGDALAHLNTAAETQARKPGGKASVLVLAYLAMTQQKLGQRDSARETLRRLWGQVSQRPHELATSQHELVVEAWGHIGP